MNGPDGERGTDWVVSDGRSGSPDPGRFRHLVEHIHDAVVEFEIVDGEPMVRGINPAFVEVFGYEPGEIMGESLNEYIVPPWLSDEAGTLDSRTTAGKVNYRHVRRETATGLREFLYRGIPYEFDDGRVGGFAVYTDLTEDRWKQKRIDVLNRLLRHNLRNQVNVITASVSRLADGADAEMAHNVSEASENLRKLTREAAEIRRTLNEPLPEDPRVDAASIARRVADRFRETHPRARIRVDLPGTLQVAATGRLEVAVESLVENAIEHNPADDPGVWIEARRVPDSEWVDLIVADDGPEIPPTEREVIMGETEIAQLDHGSGLGLWLVKWVVERFGGDLAFGTSDAGGNAVRLRLLRREA